MGQQTERRGNPAFLGLTIAVIGLIVAVILGWAMMAIGAGRLNRARQTEARANGQLMVAVDYTAKQAMGDAQQARVAVTNSNWGQAQTALSRVNEIVTLMEQVAPDQQKGTAKSIREALNQVQQAVTKKSSDDALRGLDTIVTQLDTLRQKEPGAGAP